MRRPPIAGLVIAVPFATSLVVAVAFFGLIWKSGLYRPIRDTSFETLLAFLCDKPETLAQVTLEYTARIVWGASAALVAVAAVALMLVVVRVFVDED